MMMPHHEGAIDMAKAEMSYEKDPGECWLAEEIIVDQQSEIVRRTFGSARNTDPYAHPYL